MSKLGKHGQIVHSQAREIAYNVIMYMDKNCATKADSLLQSSLATGLSTATLKRIKAEGGRSASGPTFISPTKLRKPKTCSYKLDDFDRCAVRQFVQSLYGVKKQLPTLDTMYDMAKCQLNYKGSKESFRKNLKDMGFRWRKTQSNRKLLMERKDIVSKRLQYLRAIKKYREENRTLIFIDETWLHVHHIVPKCWQLEGEVVINGVQPPSGTGPRLIVVHAGGENGFVPNALLVFDSKLKSADYHDEMNFDNFSKWLQEKLIPNLPLHSVIVMDNAPYHSKQVDKCPTTANRKDDIKAWLQRHNISFDEKMLKAELLFLAKSNKSGPVYRVDTMLKQHGHDVLRLPPYHAELNPIELIWANVKNYVASQNLQFTKSSLRVAINERMSAIGAKEWSECCKHVKTIEDGYWQREIAVEREIDRLVIDLGLASDSDTETDSESDN